MTARRFEPKQPVWVVNDRQDTPELKQRGYVQLLNIVDGYFLRRLTRVMEIPISERAQDVNALGEVPNSTWFTNRIGVREMSPEEILAGPGSSHRENIGDPWLIRETKVGGGAVGFLAENAEGNLHLLKFDPQQAHEMETGADVVVQRLLWAAGYHVPEDDVVFFAENDLTLAEDAEVKNIFGEKRSMTATDLQKQLGLVYRNTDGTYRALKSRFLSGDPLGGFPQEGRRKKDPNDTIDHEHRRSVRAMRIFFAWLEQTDVKEANTLDVRVPDPSDQSKHYVVHYLVDFGRSLGVQAVLGRYLNAGYAHADLDLSYATASLFTLGAWKRPWEGREDPGIPGVGIFDSENFTFPKWSAHFPYIPFNYLDANDAFWGTKILMRFTPAHIRAAVEAAAYSNPQAKEYLIKTLIARQRIIGAYWLRRVNPLDRFTMKSGNELCFDDLLRRYRLGTEGGTTYRVSAHDYDGNALGPVVEVGVGPSDSSAVCSPVPLSTVSGRYTIARIDTHRKNPDDGEDLPSLFVHLARLEEGKPAQVIGIDRPAP